MRHYLIIFFACIFSHGISYGMVTDTLDIKNTGISERYVDSVLNTILEIAMPAQENFKLYPTENMWTFLKLDTRTGKIWQLQYDVQGYKQTEVSVNSDIVYNNKPGRFELYATQNMYNFLLIDKVYENVYQVQWSANKKNRGIVHTYIHR